MSYQSINTIIVLRNDSTTNWENSSYILKAGEVGIGRLANGNVITKVGDNTHTWRELPQLEGVLEHELILTHDFGRYKTKNGFVETTDAKGKTISQWLIHALSEVKEPTIIQPSFTLTAYSDETNSEVGSYITALKWNATATYGSYEYGPETGLSASDIMWSISNNVTDQKSSESNGSFVLTGNKKIQLTQEASKTYATITGSYSLDTTNANIPVNNVGLETSGKITDKTGTLSANVIAAAYRKPFYGVLTTDSAVDINNIDSDIIRNLPNSGTRTRGLPEHLTIPIGTAMVIFAAKAGTYYSLTATDDKAMGAIVNFSKIPNAVEVAGANNFEPVLYDIWYKDWNPNKNENYTGIDAEKQLSLTWI